jgi:hypothetical protein
MMPALGERFGAAIRVLEFTPELALVHRARSLAV